MARIIILAAMLLGGAAWVLLWASPAGALSTGTACENAKLRAAGAYAGCLARAAKVANATGDDLSAEAIERCDARFDRAFERAEANGACRTAGGPSALRGPILGQMEDTLATATTGPGCPSTPSLDQDSSAYVCTLKSGSAVDLAAIVTQINVPDVTDDTVVWIEAWGAKGGPGNTSNGGPGGRGGYAQMTTTVNDLMASFGAPEFHYYLGVNGAGPSANAGGDGGTGTILTINDLTTATASFDDTALVAGGGGGGGGRGENLACNYPAARVVLGGAGGNGGVAIAALDTDFFGAGAKGGARRNVNYSGSGGGGDVTGSGGAVNPSGGPVRGDSGIAVIGGGGGNRSSSDTSTGFFNQSHVNISLSGGRGGNGGDDAGGGGGGGGYGGGGGGSEGDADTDCVSGGGGGGGSLAKASTQTCTRSRPSSNPGGTRGAVQIVFDAGSCG